MFDDVEQGNAPMVNYFVNQRPYNMTYYLADGIYPSYSTFVKSIRLPQSEPDKLFAKHQEVPTSNKLLECFKFDLKSSAN